LIDDRRNKERELVLSEKIVTKRQTFIDELIDKGIDGGGIIVVCNTGSVGGLGQDFKVL